MAFSPRPHRLNSAVFLIGAAVLVVLVGLLAALVTWAFHPSPVPPCTADCPPPQAPAALAAATQLPEQATFTSSGFGYHVDYASPWRVQSATAANVIFATRSGLFRVQGGQTSESAVQLI